MCNTFIAVYKQQQKKTQQWSTDEKMKNLCKFIWTQGDLVNFYKEIFGDDVDWKLNAHEKSIVINMVDFGYGIIRVVWFSPNETQEMIIKLRKGLMLYSTLNMKFDPTPKTEKKRRKFITHLKLY